MPTTIDLTLDGPKVKAAGDVKSELQPASKGDGAGRDRQRREDAVDAQAGSAGQRDWRTPSTTTAPRRRAPTPAAAQLWQGDTSIKGATIVIDDKAGDLSASGGVTTTTLLEQVDKDKQEAARPLDRDGEGLQVRGRRSAADLHRRRAHERAGGRHDGGADRALSEAVRRRTRSRRSVRERDAARAEPQDDRRRA